MARSTTRSNSQAADQSHYEPVRVVGSVRALRGSPWLCYTSSLGLGLPASRMPVHTRGFAFTAWRAASRNLEQASSHPMERPHPWLPPVRIRLGSDRALGAGPAFPADPSCWKPPPKRITNSRACQPAYDGQAAGPPAIPPRDGRRPCSRRLDLKKVGRSRPLGRRRRDCKQSHGELLFDDPVGKSAPFLRRRSHILSGGNSGSGRCTKSLRRELVLFGFCLGFSGRAADRKRTRNAVHGNDQRISKDGYAQNRTDRTCMQIRTRGRLSLGVAGPADGRRPLVRASDPGAGVDRGNHGRAGGNAACRSLRSAGRQRAAHFQAPGEDPQGEDPACGRGTQTSSKA